MSSGGQDRPARQAVRLARCFQAVLEGREHGGTLKWHGATQTCQHRPSNDVADATSMCVIVLNEQGCQQPGGSSERVILGDNLPAILLGHMQ